MLAPGCGNTLVEGHEIRSKTDNLLGSSVLRGSRSWLPTGGTAPRKKLSGSAAPAAREVAIVVAAIELATGRDPCDMLNTDETGDCVLIPDSITSCKR